MKKRIIYSILESLNDLSMEDVSLLQHAVEHKAQQQESQWMFQRQSEAVKKCPHCQSESIIKHGQAQGRQRFRCKACSKTFNALTNSPLARLRYSEKHSLQTTCMLDSLSIRKSAVKLGVSIPTAFRWRHRFLKAIQIIQPERMSGVVEADETFFRKSYKGQKKNLPRKSYKRGTKAELRGLSHEQVPVLIARDRSQQITLSTILPGRTKVAIVDALGKVVQAQETIVCADGTAIYAGLHSQCNITVKSSKKSRSGAYHIQNVNAACQRLKGWMFPFQGVATKYLENYLGWHRWMETMGKEATPQNLWKAAWA